MKPVQFETCAIQILYISRGYAPLTNEIEEKSKYYPIVMINVHGWSHFPFEKIILIYIISYHLHPAGKHSKVKPV